VKKLGKFEILDRLGEGAMGTVYRARDPTLDREVALKTVSRGLLSKPESLLRFQREARAAARLQHPGIVTIFELGQVEGQPFIAMELLEGRDLAQVVAQRTQFSLGQKLRMVADVCRALDYAHKRGVVHRDVKPANIRVLRDGSVKLVDFGIARLGESDMTQTGIVLGTPSYVAPEALTAGQVDHRTDLWAVGVVLFELLTGKRPFAAPDIAKLVYKIAREPLPAVTAETLDAPEGVARVVERALRKDPSERYHDLAEMASALELAGGLSGPLEPLLTPQERERAYQQRLAEAKRLLDKDDVESALEEARRAQALEPSEAAVLDLLRAIEVRLEDAPTLPSFVLEELTGGRSGELAPGTGPGISERLRLEGAAAFRDLGTFGEETPVQTASLCPTRLDLAACGTDGAIRVWDLRSRSRIRTLRTEMHLRAGHDARALSVAYSHDGAHLASGHVDGSVHLWDMARGVEIPVKLRHDAMVGAVAFSPDGTLLASGGMDAALKLWDMSSARGGDARRELLRQPANVTALCWGHDGSWLATGHSNRLLRLLDGASHRLLATLRGPAATVSLAMPSPDGQRLVVASQDRTLRVFDVATRSELLVVDGLQRPPASLSYIGPTAVASVALDNAVRVWDLESGSSPASLWGSSEESFASVASYGGGRNLAVVLADGRIRLWGPGSASSF
jgi:serine/threonine protein kinase